MLWPKKNSYKDFDNKKKFLLLENSPPPHNFSYGPSLIYSLLKAKCIDLSLLIDYSTYFKDVIQYYYCQFSPVSA